MDANMLFSAAKSDGAVRALVKLLLDEGHECCADAYVVAEARRNLLDKGAQAVQVLDTLLERLRITPGLVSGGVAAQVAPHRPAALAHRG